MKKQELKSAKVGSRHDQEQFLFVILVLCSLFVFLFASSYLDGHWSNGDPAEQAFTQEFKDDYHKFYLKYQKYKKYIEE